MTWALHSSARTLVGHLCSSVAAVASAAGKEPNTHLRIDLVVVKPDIVFPELACIISEPLVAPGACLCQSTARPLTSQPLNFLKQRNCGSCHLPRGAKHAGNKPPGHATHRKFLVG